MPDEKKTILVIDDDPEICEALQEILSDCGYEVVTAQETTLGYRLMEQKRPDLLVLDIMMATMHEGLDFAAKIKAKEGVWGIPILRELPMFKGDREAFHTCILNLVTNALEAFPESTVLG